MPARPLAALIDLSRLSPADARTAIAALLRPDRLGAVVTRGLVLLPPGAAPDDAAPWASVSSADTSQAVAWAGDLAAAEDAPLLVVAGGVVPQAETVGLLLDALDQDPQFGVAVARLTDRATGRLILAGQFGPSPDTAPLQVLASRADYEVTTECLAPLMVIRRELPGNLSPGWPGATDLWSGLLEYLVRARRAGFRTVVANRAIATAVVPRDEAWWGCAPAAVRAVGQAWPDLTRVQTEHALSPAAAADRVLAALAERPRSLLLDARNLAEIFNGTSIAILSMCDALHRARPESSVAVWAHPEVAAHYRFATRFPGWTISTTEPDQRFAAALRLSQPWYHSELDSLGRLAAVTACWMLDTIAWDVVYCAPPDLDAVWQRLAAESDGLFFISEFSRARFEHRFPHEAPGLREACPLSLAATDYASPSAAPTGGSPYWLIVGNRYDHKHVAPTVDVLSRAFPAQSMTVIGDRAQPRTAQVTRFDSGGVDDETMRAWYAGAGIIVFPSFYEGFGLPIVQGLACGRTVVARSSALVEELAARYRGPGRLYTFDSERGLIALLGQLSRGEAVPSVPLGHAGGAPWNWDRAAGMLLSSLDRLVAAGPSSQAARRLQVGRGLMRPR